MKANGVVAAGLGSVGVHTDMIMSQKQTHELIDDLPDSVCKLLHCDQPLPQ